MDADILRLFESDFYRISDFRCRCTDCVRSKPEYSSAFCISFVRKGNFLFNVFRHSLDSYSGCVLITKPGYEHSVTHTHTIPDECTIFDFKASFYEEIKEQFKGVRFFHDKDVDSTLVKIDAAIEYLHYYLLRQLITKSASKLEIDNRVIEIAEKIISRISDYQPDEKIDSRLKKNHLVTIERAKEYMSEHFNEDISLLEIARYCHVSPFHFSRIFKTFTSQSPHQFLLHTRLQQAGIMLKDTNLPMADIAFSSGFNSIEYFTAAFRQHFHHPPSRFRSGYVGQFKSQG